jgi:hypothetical protein
MYTFKSYFNLIKNNEIKIMLINSILFYKYNNQKKYIKHKIIIIIIVF